MQQQQGKRKTTSFKSSNNNNNNTPATAAATAAALTDLWHAAGFQALREQAAQNQSLVFIYLHSPLHRQADAMARTVLCHPSMMQFLADSHVVAMGCSIHTAQGAALQSALQCSALPCLVVLQPDTSSSSMSNSSSSSSNNSSNNTLHLLFRAQGPALLEMVQLEKTQQQQLPPSRRSGSSSHTTATTTTAATTSSTATTTTTAAAAAVEQQLIPVLRSVLQRHQAVLAGQTARRLQREQEMELRRQQDEEYQAALMADQERERQRQEEAEQERAAAAAREEAVQQAQLKIVQMQSLVRPEPNDDDDETKATTGDNKKEKVITAMIRLVLPTGQKVNRRFYADDTIGVVKAFVYLHCLEQEGMENIGLSTNFPRKTYEDDDLTLQDAGLVPQAVLMVQDLDA